MYETPEKRNEDDKKPKVIPFKVHFANKILNGKSSVRMGLPQGTPHTVTEKFYKKENYDIDPKIIEKTCKELITISPPDKYCKSITENQRYGWYYNVQLTDLDKTDPRLYFGKRMDHFIKLQLLTMDKKVHIKTEKKNTVTN